MRQTLLERYRWLQSKGFSYQEMAKLTNRTQRQVSDELNGNRKRRVRVAGDLITNLLNDVPPGRDPAEHRKIVLANFGANA